MPHPHERILRAVWRGDLTARQQFLRELHSVQPGLARILWLALSADIAAPDDWTLMLLSWVFCFDQSTMDGIAPWRSSQAANHAIAKLLAALTPLQLLIKPSALRPELHITSNESTLGALPNLSQLLPLAIHEKTRLILPQADWRASILHLESLAAQQQPDHESD
jgi:hypothetical protein